MTSKLTTFTAMAAIGNIGKIVRFHRKRANLSRIELSNISGVGKTVIYDLEKGKVTVKLSTIILILNSLNIKINLTSPLMSEYEESNN